MNAVSPPIERTKSQQLYWILQIAGWGFYSLLRIVTAPFVLEVPWGTSTLELAILGLAGFAASHGLRHYTQRHRWADLSIARLAAHIVVISFVIGAPFGIATQISDVSGLQDPSTELQRYAPELSAGMTAAIQTFFQILNWAVLFMIWLSLYFTAVGLREYRTGRLKQSELTRALQLAELRLLKSQLNPHFLFNALNTVRSLIADDPQRAQNAVTRLANTLRYTISSRQGELVTLAQEMRIVADYLELESIRFEDRLRIETQISDDSAGVLIPVMLLQTLAENAIKHGIAELPSGGVLRISAAVGNEELILEVENPRPAVTRQGSSDGIGLSNARERLRLLFNSRASLELDLSKAGIATARLRIPRQQ